MSRPASPLSPFGQVPLEWIDAPAPCGKFESAEVTCNSAVYSAALADYTHKGIYSKYIKWALMICSGLLAGGVGVVLRQSVGYFTRFRQEIVFHVIEKHGVVAGSIAHTGLCVFSAILALIITIILVPPAAGAGLTDIVAILNRVRVPLLPHHSLYTM